MARRRKKALRRKPGRAPKAPEERRRNRVMLNLTDDEYEQLSNAADERSPSEYARQVLIRHLTRRPR